MDMATMPAHPSEASFVSPLWPPVLFSSCLHGPYLVWREGWTLSRVRVEGASGGGCDGKKCAGWGCIQGSVAFTRAGASARAGAVCSSKLAQLPRVFWESMAGIGLSDQKAPFLLLRSTQAHKHPPRPPSLSAAVALRSLRAGTRAGWPGCAGAGPGGR